jgi:hypothetical protein
MAYVVIDKSYLDRVSIKHICVNHIALMPEVLFHELMTTGEESRKRCFTHIPGIHNPMLLIPDIEYLRKYELKTHRACTPLHERCVKKIYKFNEKLRDGTFRFTTKAIKRINNHDTFVKKERKIFFKLAMKLPDIIKFDEGEKFKDGIRDLMQKMASNDEMVRRFYVWLLQDDNAPSNAIRPEAIDSNWVEFRWLQVSVIYCLDLLLRYKGNIPDKKTEKFWLKIENHMLDARYVAMGALSGALASMDGDVRKYFQLVCPNGLLIPFTTKK